MLWWGIMCTNKKLQECDSCGEMKGCEWLSYNETGCEVSCCSCERIDMNKRCNWCLQDYIDTVVE